MEMYYTPNDKSFMASTDSLSIQNAIDKAHEDGLNVVKIPRWNERTQTNMWEIDSTILLPSNMHLVIDNAHLRMKDGVFCQMICNKNAELDVGGLQEGEQHDIWITGCGNATLDGGEPNGLNEYTSMQDGKPHVLKNLTIFMRNVKNFRVEGLQILNHRWWGMAFLFCQKGRITDIRFSLTRHHIDVHSQWRNQDGINLRVGCQDIEIDHITGQTGDDVIALTALNGFEEQFWVEGRRGDIKNILIHDVRATSNSSAHVRLLCHFGNKISNVTMRDIYDVGVKGKEARAHVMFWIGEDGYYQNDSKLRADEGDISDITIENIYARAMTVMMLEVGVQNLVAKNIHVAGESGYVACFGSYCQPGPVALYEESTADWIDGKQVLPIHREYPTVLKNIYMEKVFYQGSGKADSLFGFNHCIYKNLKIRDVVNESEKPMLSFFDMEKQPVDID